MHDEVYVQESLSRLKNTDLAMIQVCKIRNTPLDLTVHE